MEDVDDDLERSLLASEVLAFSAARALRARELADLARQTAAAAVDHPASGLLTEAADSLARAVMSLSVADAYTRPRAAVKLVGCAATLSMAAREVNSADLADAAYHLAEEAEELTRMAADLKASILGFARQQNRALLRRIAAFCTSRLQPSSVRSFAEDIIVSCDQALFHLSFLCGRTLLGVPRQCSHWGLVCPLASSLTWGDKGSSARITSPIMTYGGLLSSSHPGGSWCHWAWLPVCAPRLGF